MRVTQQMVSRQFIQNLNKNNESLDKIRQQISSGKQYDKVSDNPMAVMQGMANRSSGMQIEQYQKNVQDGIDRLTEADDALGNVSDVLQRIRELTVQASSDTSNADDRKSIAVEIHSLKEQLGTIANTTYNGQYLFSGTDIDTPPYSNGTLQNTSQSGTKWDVGKGVSVNVNVSAGSVFGLSVDGKNLFETIDNLAQTLDSGQNPSILLTSLDKQIDNVSARHTIVGANQNLLQLASNRLDQASNLNQKILSNIEDTDIAKAYTELSAQQATINASLAVGAKIIQPTLADFLK